MNSQATLLPGSPWRNKKEASTCYNCDFKFSTSSSFFSNIFPSLSQKHWCHWCGRVFCKDCLTKVNSGGKLRSRCPQCSVPVIFRSFKLARSRRAATAHWEATPFFTVWSFMDDASRDAFIKSSSRVRCELPLEDIPFVHSICSVFPTYFPGARVGKGGYGLVFQCRDWRSGQEDRVVLKCITKSTCAELADLSMLHKEINILRDAIDCPGIVQLKEIFQTRTQLVLVMGACEGQTVDKVAAACRARGEAEPLVAHVILSVAAALDTLYRDKGIVHRDIKPANIALSADYSEVSVLDFGLADYAAGYGPDAATGDAAAQDHPPSTTQGTSTNFDAATDARTVTREYPAVGTSFFCPPNTWFANANGYIVASGDDLHLGDYYSLGVSAYYLLTGRYLYTLPGAVTANDVRALMERTKRGLLRTAPLDNLSHEAVSLLARLVAYFPSDRPTYADIATHPFITANAPRMQHIVEKRRAELRENTALLNQYLVVDHRKKSTST